MTESSTIRHVVLLFGSGSGVSSTALASESSRLRTIVETHVPAPSVTVVSLGMDRVIVGTSEHIRLDDQPRGPLTNALTSLGMMSLRRRMATSPAGRLLNSLGPLDQGRVFARCVRRSPAAMKAIDRADIAIAADAAAVTTAWRALHSGRVTHAYFDTRSASVGLQWQLPGDTATNDST